MARKKELLYNKGDSELLKTLIKHNIVTGMSMCISKGLKEIVCPFPENIIHDYWIALVAINYGGVLSIDVPLTLYRQHKENVVGANKSIKKSLRKRNEYLTQLIAKRDMFFRLMNISCFCNNYKEIVADYVKYIQKRIDYINIKGKLPSLLLYTTYEKYPKKVLLRDVFSKLYLSIKRK